jgi:hypothetical protein
MPFPSAPTLDPRSLIVAAAEYEAALWGVKGPSDPDCHELLKAYWRAALGQWEPSLDRLAWCGIFALWAIKQGVDCPDVKWALGSGFAARWLTQTSNPAPGDIAYLASPYQHHAVVTAVDDDQITTVNGNQPGIKTATAPRHHWTCYYSIEPLLDRAAETPQ